jgi:hypothetical protein
MGQVRWVVEKIRDNCKKVWNLGKYFTIDEMMVGYKGSYCPARQYLPNKPTKWGIKIWCLADSMTKFVYNFEVYCGRNGDDVERATTARGEPRQAHEVVLRLVEGLENRNHVMVCNNFFSSVGLFMELKNVGIYATGTMRSNRVGLPLELKNTRAFSRVPQETLEWRMHESRTISCVLWKDKKPILLISTHAMPIGYPCEPVITVPRRNGPIREDIHTSPVHHEYTTHMRGVDVADQLRASYTSQTRSHKWWHRIWHFLLDLSEVNMFILYTTILNEMAGEGKPISHMQFKSELYDALIADWRGRRQNPNMEVIGGEEAGQCVPRWTRLRWKCVVCGRRCRYYCTKCEEKSMCLNKGCFERYHSRVARWGGSRAQPNCPHCRRA